MRKKFLASICAIACVCTMSSPVYAKELTNVAGVDLAALRLEDTTMQTMSEKGNYNISVCSDTSKLQETDITAITGTLNASNTTDSCTITVPERAALAIYSSAAYPSASVSIELKSQTGESLASQYLFSSTTENSTDVKDEIFVEPGTYTFTYSVNANVTGNITYNTKIMAWTAATEETVNFDTGYVGFQKAGEEVYKKVTVTKSGLLQAEVEEMTGFGKAILAEDKSSLAAYGEKVTLCNSKKVPITEENTTSSYNGYVNFYAVKAGTYYLKMSSNGDNYYTLGLQFTVGGTTNNTSKAKAQKLSNKYKSTLMPIGGSTKTRWYKITLKKKKKIAFSYEYYGTGDKAVKVVVCNKKGKEITTSSNIYGDSKNTLSTTKKYPKGTYYIKISKPDSSIYSMGGMLRLKVK